MCYLQIKFEHKILLSSTYVIQFYKGDSPSWEKREQGSFFHDNGKWNSVAKNNILISAYKWHSSEFVNFIKDETHYFICLLDTEKLSQKII